MARVPVITGPTVNEAPLPVGYQTTQGASLDAFGNTRRSADLINTGKAISQQSDVLAQDVLRAQIEDNERQTKNMDIQLSARIRELQYGDGTEANKGFFGAMGENALANKEAHAQALKDAAKEVAASASNPRVGTLFQNVANARIEGALKQADTHVAQQREVANDATSLARQHEFAKTAGANWSNDKIVADNATGAFNEAYHRALDKLGNEDTAKQLAKTAQSNVYIEAIRAASVNDPIKALQIYTMNADNIDGDKHHAIEQLLKPAITKKRATDLASSILAVPGITEVQAIKMLREKAGNADEMEAAWTQVHQVFSAQHAQAAEARARAGEARAITSFNQNQQEYADKKKAEAGAVAAFNQAGGNYDKALQIFHESVGPSARPGLLLYGDSIIHRSFSERKQAEQAQERNDFKDMLGAVRSGTPLTELDQNILNRMDPAHRDAIEKGATWYSNGRPPMETGPAGTDAVLRIFGMTPEERQKVDINALRQYVSDRDYESVKKLLEADALGKNDHELAGLHTRINDIAGSQGILDKEKLKSIHVVVQEQFDALRAGGKHVDAATRDKIIHDNVDPIVIKEAKILFQSKHSVSIELSKVPAEWRREKRSANPGITNQELLKAWYEEQAAKSGKKKGS